MNAFYTICKGIATPLFKLLYPYRVVNKNSLPPTGKFILCSNHISMVDPIFLGLTQKRRLHFMAKEELFRNKFFSAVIRKLGAFPVSRGSGDTKAMENAFHILAQGSVLGIFPEGTRSKDGKLLRPKPGIAIFAHQGQAPILPVAIVAKNGNVRLFHKTAIVYGSPIQPEELAITTGSGPELRNASRLIMSRIAALREEGLRIIGQVPPPEKKRGEAL